MKACQSLAGAPGAVATAGVPLVLVPAFCAQDIGTVLARRELRVDSLVAALQVEWPDVREQAKALGI